MDGLADSSQGISMERNGIKSSEELRRSLRAVDRKSYPAYKSLAGGYDFGRYQLWIDHVQGDPFASPSNVHIEISQKVAGFPEDYHKAGPARRALSDFLIRQFAGQVGTYNFKAKGSGKSGLITITRCGQEVLERSACEMDEKRIQMRFFVGFPAFGRTIQAGELEKILFEFLPACVEKSLIYRKLDQKKVQQAVWLAEDQAMLRQILKKEKLVAFVANGSVLPRKSGVSDLPMKDSVPFESPASMERTFVLPHRGEIRGMAVPEGITLIVGGGYHGKSTLLDALQMGVYDHIAGDGREFVLTENTAVKLRAEDGRSVKNVDKGYDGSLTWRDRIGSFSYHLGGTLTYMTNKLIEGGEEVKVAGFNKTLNGYPLNSVFGYRYVGKIQNEEQLKKYTDRYLTNNSINMPSNIRLGDHMYEDVNKDGKLTQDDLIYLGSDDPKFSFSFNFGFEWKGFDFSTVFQGVGKRTIFRENDAWKVPYKAIWLNTTNQSVGNVWSPETPDNHFPTYSNNTNINDYNYLPSTWSADNGSYLRLKDVVLGYTLPSLTKF